MAAGGGMVRGGLAGWQGLSVWRWRRCWGDVVVVVVVLGESSGGYGCVVEVVVVMV